MSRLSAVERRFLGSALDRLHQRDPWTRGHFAEALVCELLPGAVQAAHSAAAYDISWESITIAVRSTATRSTSHLRDPTKSPFAGSWSFKPKLAWDHAAGDWHKGDARRCWAEVAVLCLQEGEDVINDWRFFVLSARDIVEYPSQTFTPRNLASNGYVPLQSHEVENAVRSAAAGR